MLWIVERIKKCREIDYIEFMIHFSELTAGVNPIFKSRHSIEALYEQLDNLFEVIEKDFDGIGISDYVKEKYC